MNQPSLSDRFEKEFVFIKRHVQEILSELFRSFWDYCPEVQSIVWVQYTPYFNDGEECIFSIDIPTFCNTDNPEYAQRLYEGEDIGIEGLGSIPYKEIKKNKIAKELVETIRSPLGMEIFRLAFGDGYMVVATKQGFSILPYDHE